MLRGIVIYNSEDYKVNMWFASQFVDNAHKYDMNISLCLSENLFLSIDECKFSAYHKDESLSDIDFVINRTRNYFIAKHFESMGIRVFNNSEVARICNDKWLTHSIMAAGGIHSIKTVYVDKKNFNHSSLTVNYPVVLKSVSGHGGLEVVLINDKNDLLLQLDKSEETRFVLQHLASQKGLDIRVYLMGERVLGAVKRVSETDVRANVSLGARASRYELRSDELQLVNKIGSMMNFDFVGIDFIMDDGRLILNEIEDVVGTRSLYSEYDVDVVGIYLAYIRSKF